MNKHIEMFLDIINTEEFGLVRYANGIWGLEDFQGANLGGICNESFNTIAEILYRMEIYHIDYFEESFMEFFEIDDHNGYIDLVKQCREKLKQDNADYSEIELQYLEFIANAPTIEICNTPLEELKAQLYYEQYEFDYEEEEI